MVNRLLCNCQCNRCALAFILAGVIQVCYTVFTSSNENETDVHGCNPSLLVSVMLVSRKVNFVM